MWISFKILILLWAINLAPPFLTYLLHERWSAPIDGGLYFRDFRPILGAHKTVRGALGGIATGALVGSILGLPFWVGLLAGGLSMTGDLFSSFIKRRLDQPSGSLIPGLDQLFEGLLPFGILGPYCSLGGGRIIILVALFSIGAYIGSWFFERILLTKPFEAYSRSVTPLIRFREWRACQTVESPLHPFLNFERAIYYHILMKTVFRLIGLYQKGMRNALDIQEQSLTYYFRRLPIAFDNYTILFLSDLHLDCLDGLTQRLQNLVGNRPVDLCILGGDFRTELSGPFTKVLGRLKRLVRTIRAQDGIYAVLGNHDCLEILYDLQETPITFLVNDAVAIDRYDQQIWIVGVDDPHYYRAHDLEKAFQDVPAKAFSVLVAHSPEIYREAVRFDPRLYLCGHTHAGQIQMPGIGPVFTHSRAPRRLSHGPWTHAGMLGYTSAGAGVSGIPVRFGCRGEVVLITLKRHPAEKRIVPLW